MSHESFFTTQWTRVIAAQGESECSREALGDLCQSYYTPVIAFLRKEGRSKDSAQEFAHSFFAWLLSRDALAKLEPRQTRFRSYLLGALKHFLSNQRQRSTAQKRGSHLSHVSIQADLETSVGLDPTDPFTLPPDREFDRQWALHLIHKTLETLQREWDKNGKIPTFEQLRPFLDGNAPHGALARLATETNTNENTLRSTLHRLRARFRQLLKLSITPTVHSDSEINSELEILSEALASS